MAKSPSRPLVWLKVAGGIGLIVAGVLGHIIPLVPGGIIIAAGILLLAEVSPTIRKQVRALEARYPRLHVMLARVRTADGSLDPVRIVLVLLAICIVSLAILYLMHRLWPWLSEGV